ncbi:hypothetical protein EDB92DRAFT_1950167 [Lactarius akahatsu]|uniref:Uncharacterized protein n=1 Tax=Lactarius akahatsu TaxID=416441 RepID=A0AAD4QAC3_9AGAM|nr:hypothetical protein EDB92DRAFT_1950167 [Lactarius akahatsu]
MTIAGMNDADVLDGLLGALDFHEFVLGHRLLGFDAKTENTQTPPSTPPPDGNGNTVFAAVTNLKAYPTALHAALPPRAALLFFSGHGDPRSMTTHAARRAEYRLTQNQRHGNLCSSGTGAGDGAVL